MSISLYIYTYIYVYVYVDRGQEVGRQEGRQRDQEAAGRRTGRAGQGRAGLATARAPARASDERISGGWERAERMAGSQGSGQPPS